MSIYSISKIVVNISHYTKEERYFHNTTFKLAQYGGPARMLSNDGFQLIHKEFTSSSNES